MYKEILSREKYLECSSLLLGLILIGSFIVGQDFITAWLGSGYEEAFVCTLLFIMPAVMLLPADIADQTLIASGNVKYRAFVYIIMMVVNIPLSVVMTKYWGLNGLAISIFIAYMVRNVAMYYVYYSKLHINVWQFIRDSYIRMLPGLLVSCASAYVLASFLDIGSWYSVACKSAIVVICYVIAMWILAMNEGEKELVKKIFLRLCRRV